MGRSLAHLIELQCRGSGVEVAQLRSRGRITAKDVLGCVAETSGMDTTVVSNDAASHDGARATYIRQPEGITQNLLAFGLFGIAFYLAYRYGMSFSQTTAAPF